MTKILLIARREFLMTVAQKPYLLSLVGLPLLFLVVGGVARYALSDLANASDALTVGVVDRAGIVDFNLAGTVPVVEASSGGTSQGRPVNVKPYSDLEGGLRDLREARVNLVCLIEPDFLEQGRVKLYTRAIWVAGEPPGMERFRALLRASLLERFAAEAPPGGVSAEEVAGRLLAPAKLSRLALSEDGGPVVVGNTRQILGRLLVPYGLILLLTISVFVSANYLLEATGEEKENRVVEIMLSSVKPAQLMWGKILGLGGAALLHAVTYAGLIGAVMIFYGEDAAITAGGLVLSLVFCLAGYLLYAGLLAAVGIMGGNLHNNSQLATPLMMIVATPLLLEFLILDEPNGTLARVLSFIPLTAPLTMIYRLSLSSVPPVDIVITLCLLLGSAYLAVRGAAKIFRAAALMYGKRITGPEVVRWLREA